MLSHILARLLMLSHPALKGFDPAFYLEQHPDLYQFSGNPLGLIHHYLAFGRQEGRFCSEEAVMQALRQRLGAQCETFDPRIYELLNEDLGRALSRRHEFARQFLDHGRQEGRPWQITEVYPTLPGRYWPALFRTADFLSYADLWLPERPATREHAIRAFIEHGVERLAPINLKHVFDPAFYRAAYPLPPEAMDSDVAAYRHWLSTGLELKYHANEAALLAPYLKGRITPAEFDWQACRAELARKAGLSLRTGAQVLAHVFDAGLPPAKLAPYLHGPAVSLLEALAEYAARRGRNQLALDYLDLAAQQQNGQREPSMESLRLRLLHRLGRKDDESTALAQKVLALPGMDFETYHSIIRARLACADIEGAFEALAVCRASWRKLARYRPLLYSALDHAFHAVLPQAVARYRLKDRAGGDALIRSEIERCVERLKRLDDMPPHLGPHAEGPVVTLANQELFQCKHYRVSQRLEMMAAAGLPAMVFDEGDVDAFIAALPGARAAVFYRTPATPPVVRAMLNARMLGIPVFFEVDDILFDGEHFPDSLESYEGQISTEAYEGLLVGVPLFRFALDWCDHAIASTPALVRGMRALKTQGDVHLIRNGLDSHAAVALERQARNATPRDGTLRLFYGSGTKSHNSDFTRFAGPGLLRALQHHPNIELVIAGHLKLDPAFKPFAARIRILAFTPDLQDYWATLAQCDINIAVLKPGFLADTKSEIKWLEAAMLGVPSIVTPTATYREVLENRETVLFAQTPEEWAEALETLIQDAELRQTIGKNARALALKDYTLGSQAPLLRHIFAAAPAQPVLMDSVEKRLKLLVCHVFFAPQTYGGATRVVEDNVKWMNANDPGIEVSVFTSDEGVQPKGQLRIETVDGTTVYRISVDAGREADMRLFDPDIAERFRFVLAQTQPDIVHFHCIQRLSASLIEATQAAAIPYVITLHDGWWISDHQFLLDQDGFLSLPRSSSAASVQRHDITTPLLRGARALLAVSEAFSRLHAQLGLANLITVANGTPVLPHVHKAPSLSGRVRLAHIGDRSVHKGAILVEAVLRRSQFANLELTMIDNTLPEGETVFTQWGLTPVRLQGPVRQHQVQQLYAQMDVLLAPSIWPESFGLVVREALAAGVYVIVSDRGALQDEVIAGETGEIISVESSQALQQALQRLNDSPSMARRHAAGTPAMHRSSDDQARELVALYRREAGH